MDWQERQRQENARRAQQDRLDQQRRQQERFAQQRAAQEQRVLQQRLAREALQRQQAVQKQEEFNQKQRLKQKVTRVENDRALQVRLDEKQKLLNAKPNRSKNNLFRFPAKQNTHFNPVPSDAPRFSDFGSAAATLNDPSTSSGSITPASSGWFPSIDRRYDRLLASPARARKVLGCLALLGFLAGIGYASSIHHAVLSYGIVGAVLGLLFLPLLKLSIKVVLTAAILGIAGLLVYALIHLAK